MNNIDEIKDALFDIQSLMLNAYDRIESIDQESGIESGEAIAIDGQEAEDIRSAYDKLTKLRKELTSTVQGE